MWYTERMERPRVVVFYGGPADNHDLSRETGHWACKYIPRSKYSITPVEVTADGKWKVPLGDLPRTGPVERTIDMLSQAVKALNPKDAIGRLLSRPIDSVMTVVRGKGGDDGGLHSAFHTLDIPVIGSPLDACLATHNKYAFSHAVGDITNSPYTRRFRKKTPLKEIVSEVQEEFMPPFFVKPVAQEGSVGIELVESMDELVAAIKRVKKSGSDVLVQEYIPGDELSVTVVEDEKGKVHVLPPTVIVPQKSLFYDHDSKRRGGRVKLHTPSIERNGVIAEAQSIARDVYDEMGCRGIATMDMIAGNNAVEMLEVNTIPTYSDLTPLKYQLQAADLHPATLLDHLIVRSLETSV